MKILNLDEVSEAEVQALKDLYTGLIRVGDSRLSFINDSLIKEVDEDERDQSNDR
jgi:hypothetical protein